MRVRDSQIQSEPFFYSSRPDFQRLDHLDRDDEPGWRRKDLRRGLDAARRSRVRRRRPGRLLLARQGNATALR